MRDRSDIDQLIASQLTVAPEAVRDDMAFASTSGWDSLAHISLMMAIEERYGVSIGEEEMLDLTTVGAIRDFVDRLPSPPSAT